MDFLHDSLTSVHHSSNDFAHHRPGDSFSIWKNASKLERIFTSNPFSNAFNYLNPSLEEESEELHEIMPSIPDMPPEILIMIFSELSPTRTCTSSRSWKQIYAAYQDLRSICLVSKHFQNLVLPILYSHIRIRSVSQARSIFQNLHSPHLSSVNLKRVIKSVTISPEKKDLIENRQKNMEIMKGFLKSTLSQLESVRKLEVFDCRYEDLGKFVLEELKDQELESINILFSISSAQLESHLSNPKWSKLKHLKLGTVLNTHSPSSSEFDYDYPPSLPTLCNLSSFSYRGTYSPFVTSHLLSLPPLRALNLHISIPPSSASRPQSLRKDFESILRLHSGELRSLGFVVANNVKGLEGMMDEMVKHMKDCQEMKVGGGGWLFTSRILQRLPQSVHKLQLIPSQYSIRPSPGSSPLPSPTDEVVNIVDLQAQSSNSIHEKTKMSIEGKIQEILGGLSPEEFRNVRDEWDISQKWRPSKAAERRRMAA